MNGSDPEKQIPSSTNMPENADITPPRWFKLLRWCRWAFYALPLWYFPIHTVPRLLIAVVVVLLDYMCPGLAEKLLILSMLGGFIASWAIYGPSSIFSVGFAIFIVWYVGGGIASYLWMKNKVKKILGA